MINDGNISYVQHDEAGHMSEMGYGISRLTGYNTNASSFVYPHASLDWTCPTNTLGSVGTQSHCMRLNGAGMTSMHVGIDSYNGIWIQAIQDDGSNLSKKITLNPAGGPVYTHSTALDDGNGNISAGGGSNIMYRCTSAKVLPVGALTIVPTDCGSAVDTGLRVK